MAVNSTKSTLYRYNLALPAPFFEELKKRRTNEE